jgi:hypothetical protein
MEVIKVEPDLDTASLNKSPFYEGPFFDETQEQGQDPLLIESAEVKEEVKVSVHLVDALCKGIFKDRFSLIHVTLIADLHSIEICTFLGYYVVLCGNCLLMFRGNVLVPL